MSQFSQSFKMALKSIAGNKLRAFLTMLGIIIGVMALVILVSLVNGATSTVTDTISSLGSTMLTVTVEDDKCNPITMETLNEWQNKGPVGLVAPYGTTSVTGKYGSATDSVTVYGTTPGYADINGLKVELGRFLKTADVENNSYVCVLSSGAAESLVGYTDCLGEQISLDGTKYTVVGVLESDEGSLASMFRSKSSAYIPYTSLMRLSTTVSYDVDTFCMAPAEGSTMDMAEDYMTLTLMERFDQDEDAFEMNSSDALEDAMSSVTDILAILLGGIAAISLIVGGIGIMNIMLVTVTERTREIGIRKAIGATRGVILQQFLLEAVVLCMMGCLIGIFLSWATLRAISVVVSSLSIVFSMEINVVIISVVFCFFIGIVFGLYPANKAAKMLPIDALHYGG